uniref:SUN domain-containing protein n=1 Tax=Esox lucius TaxID=8010 RepID=A0A3P8ZJ50_ESOLU
MSDFYEGWTLESWGWTDISSYSTTALDFEKEHRIPAVFQSPRMSRRSLRLHTTTGLYGDDSMDPSVNHLYHSASFSAGGVSQRESKLLKSRRSQQHSVSCSQSLLLSTPRKSQHGSQQHNSSLHSVAASDASLLSSMLDESCIQERTLVDSFWGLDEDAELKERTMTVEQSLCGVNGDINSAQTQTSMLNGSTCKDCTIQSDRKKALPTHSSSKYSSSAAPCASSSHALPCASSPPSTVYAREKIRRHNTGPPRSVSDACVLLIRWAAARAAFVFLLLQNALLRKPGEVKGHSSYCGSINVKEFGTDGKPMNRSGSLWKAVTRAFGWLGTGWYQLVTLMSLLNILVLTRCLPKLLKLLLVLLPFLLLLGLWHWGLSSMLSLLPAVNVTEWRTAFSFLSGQDQSPLEKPQDGQPAMPPPPPQVSQPGSVLVSVDAERLAQLEHRLAQLWDKVEGGERSREQQHGKVLGLYQALQEQLDTRTDRDRMGLWVSSVLDERLTLLKSEMENDAARQREPSQTSQEQVEVWQKDQASRLAQLEALLQTLAAQTEEVQRRQEETAAAVPVSGPVPVPVQNGVGVNSESHDALLAEVKRLEAALGGIRNDLQGVMGCQGACHRLDTLHETVSAQVKRELRSLFYGSERAADSQPGEEELPETLLPWLSERYVSGADLQTSLASLELSILQNVSRQLEENRAGQETLSRDTVTQTVMNTVGATGMSEEHVQLIVKNALNLYSQDRTGLADYALESGGGSVLSTRCSETYETKTALMSLFGLPLWYFSQSPRVVIQPDVHPGNCWAFQGSQGYLVVRLSMRIVPSAFSLEHAPKALSPLGSISSAPRHFNVYGLDDEYQDEGKLLGSYTYQEDGDSLQTYPVTEENDRAYQIIEVRVLSNWGNPEYTCLYRFRVHGQPSPD